MSEARRAGAASHARDLRGLQVIGTRVADDETCTVIIDDGRVRGAGPDQD